MTTGSTSERLARWFDHHLVNRRDVWGLYLQDGKSITAPSRARRGKDRLTLNHLINHVAGRLTLGLHTTALDDTCRWLAFDIDAHNDLVIAADNWRIAQDIADICRSAGLEVIIEDSNGKGGFHIWIIFSSPIAAELAYRLARWFKTRAGADEVEAFPKQPTINGRCGNFLRIPGKHHKRDHWSRIWDADREIWLAGEDAAEALIASPINDPEVLIDLMPCLPALPVATANPTMVNAADGFVPVCIRDLMENNIRRQGDRNRAVMSLARFAKAAGLPADWAIVRGVELTRRIPAGLTSANLTDQEIEGSVRSVVQSVFGSPQYRFECWHVLTLGVRGHPITCDGVACRLIRREVPVETLPDVLPEVPVDTHADHLEVPVT